MMWKNATLLACLLTLGAGSIQTASADEAGAERADEDVSTSALAHMLIASVPDRVVAGFERGAAEAATTLLADRAFAGKLPAALDMLEADLRSGMSVDAATELFLDENPEVLGVMEDVFGQGIADEPTFFWVWLARIVLTAILTLCGC
jgi:hypothetical protein